MSSGTHWRTQDVQALLTALDRLYTPVSAQDFPGHLFGVLADLLPGTLATLDFADLATGRIESRVDPLVTAEVSAADLEAIVRAYLWQHPVMPLIAAGQTSLVLQPTDVVSQREFRRTDLYALAFRPARIEYQIAAGLSWPGHVGGFTVNRPRTRNFTEREATLVRCLRPHVERAFAAALRPASWPYDRHRAPVAAGDVRADGFLPRKDPLPHVPLLPAVHNLTPREGDVLRWLSVGKRNAEIATILGISPRTVHKHVEHLFAKLGVETRAAAVAAVAWGG